MFRLDLPVIFHGAKVLWIFQADSHILPIYSHITPK